MLKKTSEEGMEFLQDAKSRATSLVSFKSGGGRADTFVVKQGRVFGNLFLPETGLRIHLTACPGVMRCQLLVTKMIKQDTR